MSKEISGATCPQVVYVVMCYQSIFGIYSSQEDAAQVQRDLINKNRAADIFCRPIVYSLNQ